MVRSKIKDAMELKVLKVAVYIVVIIVLVLLSTLYVQGCI
jgi:hypothetical protein